MIDITIDGVPYNEAIEISADSNDALATIDTTEQYGVRPAVVALERDSAGNWQSKGLLTPPASNGPNQFFGCSISIDTDTALIGSCYRQHEQWPTDFSSNVTVYRKDSAGQWIQSATLPVPESYPQDQELPSFGYTVALDGDTAVVGLYGGGESAPNGVVLIFERFGEENWSHQATLRSNTPTNGDVFGKSVAISGNDLFVAERMYGQSSGEVGQISLFTRNEASQWEFVEAKTTWSNTFSSKLVSTDTTLLVPSTRVDTADDGSVTSVGIVHVVKRDDNGKWRETQTLEVSDTLRDAQSLTPRVATNNEHMAAQLYYFGRYADGNGVYGSLQDQQIRIFDLSADGQFRVSRTIETEVPSADLQYPLDIRFAGADILTGGTVADLLVISDDSVDNSGVTQSSGGGGSFRSLLLVLLLTMKRRSRGN